MAEPAERCQEREEAGAKSRMPQRWESVKGPLRLLVLIIPALQGWPFVLILGRFLVALVLDRPGARARSAAQCRPAAVVLGVDAAAVVQLRSQGSGARRRLLQSALALTTEER
jgi:hypothetical protein